MSRRLTIRQTCCA